MMTDNEVFAALCSCLETGRDEMGLSGKWTVLARNAQVMANADRVILVDKIDERQKGFQNTRFETDPEDGRLHEYWEWIEEYRFQVSCVRERKVTDKPVTVTADEVAARLKAWIHSDDGIAVLREKGLAPLCISGIVPNTYTSENEMYQRYVHFDLAVQVVQVIDKTPPAVDAIELGIEHVPHCNEREDEVVFDKIWPPDENPTA